MQKVDLVIAIVGVAAVVATTLGVVFYEELAGEQTLEFDVVTDEGYFMGGTQNPVGSGPREFAFALPDNATSASIDVTITFQGQSGAGSNIAVSAYFVDPTGNRSNEASDSLNIGSNQGAGASVTLSLTGTWADVPDGGNTTDIDAAAQAATISWENKPLIVYVTIGASNDALAGTLPTVSYNYDIDVTGDLMRFERAAPEIGDPSTV